MASLDESSGPSAPPGDNPPPAGDQPSGPPEVFISYSSRDRSAILGIRNRLESAGVTTWIDTSFIDGGQNYGPAIGEGIRSCRVLLLCCSASSMRSRNVGQEIALAWRYDRQILPLLIDDTVLIAGGFPEQLEYWLEGHQWIEALPPSSDRWFPQLLRSLEKAKVGGIERLEESPTEQVVEPIRFPHGIDGLFRAASYSDQIWPIRPAEAAAIRSPATRGSRAGVCRDIAAPQVGADRQFRIDEHLHLVIEHCGERDMYLTLLERGTSGKIYSVCPSRFIQGTSLTPGRHILPPLGSPYPTFLVSGPPGTEELLTVLTLEPLDLDWMPADQAPARVLSQEELDEFCRQLDAIPVNERQAFATYFEIIP